ncbi:PREDICTED: pectinesterase inhibitor-like [Nelumbo nucifera]|nr:PREDICTED: pectinesterase inhibitor-like [Nelumbo nucifera]
MAICLTLVPDQAWAVSNLLSVDHPGGGGIPDLIKETCQHAVYTDLCIQTMELEPDSAKSDIKSLASIALKIAASNGTYISDYIRRLIQTTADPYLQQCLTDCSENYIDAIDQLEDSISALESRGYSDINHWVTGAMNEIESCEEGFKEVPGHTSLLSDKNALFTKLCSNALAIANYLAGRRE